MCVFVCAFEYVLGSVSVVLFDRVLVRALVGVLGCVYVGLINCVCACMCLFVCVAVCVDAQLRI